MDSCGGIMIFFVGPQLMPELANAILTVWQRACGLGYKAMGATGSLSAHENYTWYVRVVCFEACAFPTISRTSFWILEGVPIYCYRRLRLYASWLAHGFCHSCLDDFVNIMGARLRLIFQTILTAIIFGEAVPHQEHING